MLFNKEEALKRLLKYHPKNGRVHTAFLEVVNTKYPNGTNLLVEFYKKFIGLPYGAKNMCMEDKVDCAELPRIGNYIFFGKDIGNFTDAQYKNKTHGVTVGKDYDDLPKARILDQPFYKTSTVKVTGHTSIKIDDSHIIQSGASEHNKRVGISNLYWRKGKYKLVAIRRFITDEELASITVNSEIEKGEEIMINGSSDKETVKQWQIYLDKSGFRGEMNPDKYGNWGEKTEDATKAFQKSVGLPEKGVVDTWTLLKMVDVRAAKAPVVEPTKPAPAPTYPKYKYGGASYTNLRNKPSTVTGKKIDKIVKGEIVEKIGEKGSWWNVKFNGKAGWCANTRLFKKV